MVLRLVVYSQNRSLIIDEANLARNIVEKDYSEFFAPLDYEQYAPPLFSVVSKISVDFFGVNELALKLTALLGGCLSLILLYFISRKLIHNRVSVWYILGLWAFSAMAVRYSTEFKQYGLDAAICLLFILWAYQITTRKNPTKQLVWLGLTGSICIWLSMPLIFVLAAIGLLFLHKAWYKKELNITLVLSIGAVWLGSFGIYYFSILHTDANSDYLQNYHQMFFFNFFPTSGQQLSDSWDLLVGMFRTITDQTIISIVWAMLTFSLGSYFLIKEKKEFATLLLLPILFSLLASHLQLYSLIPRLILFLVPIFLLVMGFGISKLWLKSNLIVKILLILPMLVSLVNANGYKYFFTKMEFEDSKGVMAYLEDHRTNDELIFVQHEGVPAFYFYNHLHENSFGFKNYHLGHWQENFETKLREKVSKSDTDSFWLFLAHTFPQEKIAAYLHSTEKIADKKVSFQRTGASTFQFEAK